MKASDMIIDKLPTISNPSSASTDQRSKGPSYILGGKPIKYFLPPPSGLKPFYDTKAGELDTWPAHASKRGEGSQSIALTRDKRVVLLNNGSKGVETFTPRPKFLDELQRYLQEELRVLGVLNAEPSELRLQAYREVFEYLIEDFKTYKPLLSAIKDEYEKMLANQREQIQELLPLKQMLVTVSERCDQKILVMREEEKQEIIVLKNENKALRKKIDDMNRDQVALRVQVERLQDELAAEYLRYRDECDARKLLIADINDLRFQQEESKEAAKQMHEDGETEHDDPHMLKIALKKAREDEASASKRLNDMIANYGNVIPMRDFEQMKKINEQLTEKLDFVKKEFQRLQEEHNAFLEVHRQVLQQRDDYYTECDALRRTATPRPNWDVCAKFVDGGETRWRELYEGKRSNVVLDLFLDEIGKQNNNDNKVEYFEGPGFGPNVPEFLQFEGQVRNRNLSKRDCLLVIKDVWQEKITADSERNDGLHHDLGTFLLNYLKKRFGSDQIAFEWICNINDACERFVSDDRIRLFGSILKKEADEELYYNHLRIASDLDTRLMKMDVDKGNTGQLSREDFIIVLREYFPLKDDSQIEALVKAAELELEASDKFQYKKLFREDDEGKAGPFIDEIRHQSSLDRMKYVDDIKAALVADTGFVSPDQLSKAIKICDPQITNPDLDRYVTWAFNVQNKSQLNEAEPKPIKDLTLRLMNGNISRIGLKPGE